MALQFNTFKKKKKLPTPSDTAVPSQAQPIVEPQVEGPVVAPNTEHSVNNPDMSSLIVEPQVEGPKLDTTYQSQQNPPANPPAQGNGKFVAPKPIMPDDLAPDAAALMPKRSGQGMPEVGMQMTPQVERPQVRPNGSPNVYSPIMPTDLYPDSSPGTTTAGVGAADAAIGQAAPAAANPFDEIYEQVYGHKPGFVATDDPDGGFFEYASQFIDPEKAAKRKRANKTRLGILALGDAIRNFGNIYHTTKGAPSQKFNAPVDEEVTRQEKEEAQLREQINKQIERAEKEKERLYSHLVESRKYADTRADKEAAQKREDRRLKNQEDQLAYTKERDKVKDEQWQKEHDEKVRHNKVQEGTSAARVYIGGGGGGRRRSSGGRGYSYYRGGGSGGRKGSAKGRKTTPQLLAPGKTPGEQDKIVEDTYRRFVRKGHVHKGRKGVKPKLQELTEAYRTIPEAREYLDSVGFQMNGGEYGDAQQGGGEGSQSATYGKRYFSRGTLIYAPTTLTTSDGRAVNVDSDLIVNKAYEFLTKNPNWKVVRRGCKTVQDKINAMWDAARRGNKTAQATLDSFGFTINQVGNAYARADRYVKALGRGEEHLYEWE